MTSDWIYIKMSSSSNASHWLPHFVLDTLFLQDISYQTYVHGVVASRHKDKMALWPPFPLSTRIYKIENFKKAKE